MDQVVIDYLNPSIPGNVRLLDVPLVRATPESLAGYGEIVRDPKAHPVEIVPWPLAGWRRLDAGTGIEGGTTEGIFTCEWRGNELLGRNDAVGGHYVIGFREPPELARQPAMTELHDTTADASGTEAGAAETKAERMLQHPRDASGEDFKAALIGAVVLDLGERVEALLNARGTGQVLEAKAQTETKQAGEQQHTPEATAFGKGRL